MKKFLAYIVGVSLLCGCSLYQIDSDEISTNYYPSKTSTQSISYIENVKDPHDVIGFVTVNAERRQKISEVLLKMKREAAIMGGDAITKIETDATGSWKALPAQELIGNGYIRANFRSSVIIFK